MELLLAQIPCTNQRWFPALLMNGCYTLQLEVSAATNCERIFEVEEEGTGAETEKA